MLLGNWTRRLFVGRNAAFPPSINDLCNKMVSNGLAQDLCVPSCAVVANSERKPSTFINSEALIDIV
jgi:hypothetical protein